MEFRLAFVSVATEATGRTASRTLTGVDAIVHLLKQARTLVDGVERRGTVEDGNRRTWSVDGKVVATAPAVRFHNPGYWVEVGLSRRAGPWPVRRAPGRTGTQALHRPGDRQAPGERDRHDHRLRAEDRGPDERTPGRR
jgi:hypothetical protein